ncbi:DNA polymerase III subunit delta, partial [Streptomyces sp. NPDC004285]
MATRKTSPDDLLGPVTLAVGQEDLLLDRAVRDVVAGGRGAAAAPRGRGHAPPHHHPGGRA